MSRSAATPPVTVTRYQPAPALDAELAALGYAAAAGWPDQRPITASLVRSRLRPTGPNPTLLAVQRAPDGHLRGAAALRWPTHPTSGNPGRLWGPVVHPIHQREGVGSALLHALAPHLTGIRVTTAEIPSRRRSACLFYERAGWHPAGGATLLKRSLPLTGTPQPPAGWRLRPMHPGEDLHHAIAELYATNNPYDVTAAANTFTRWTADERFTLAGLTCAEDDNRVGAVALVYPLAHSNPTEPPEALLADVLIDPTTGSASLCSALIAATLNAIATKTGATVARAVAAPESAISPDLDRLGFDRVDQLRYFRNPS